MSEKVQISKAVLGDRDYPGDAYRHKIAQVYQLPSGRYELQTIITQGSNQGHLEEHHRDGRTYRANTLDDLLRIGLTEIRNDDIMNDSELLEAIRRSIFEAEDSISE